jgi:surface polysaccharide O-acyltransferase-like enzyme
LIRKVEKGKLLKAGEKTPLWLIILFVFPIWGAAQILNAPIVCVYRVAFYFVFFILGFYIFSNDAVIDRLKRISVPLILIAVTLCVIFTVSYFGENYADKPINRGFLYVLDAYAGSLAMLSGMARFGDFSNAFTKWMSDHSFGLYVFHYLGKLTVGVLYPEYDTVYSFRQIVWGYICCKSDSYS